MRRVLLFAAAVLLYPAIGVAEDQCWEVRCQPAPSWCVMGVTPEGREIVEYGHAQAPTPVECPKCTTPDWLTVEKAHSAFFAMDENQTGVGWTQVTLYRYFTGLEFVVRLGVGSQMFDSYQSWLEATE